MVMKYVILARPSSLIVSDMKNLIARSGYEPKPIAELRELDDYDPTDVSAIVVSTALSSAVKESYGKVIERSMERFPGKPLFLASFASVKSTKLVAGDHLKKQNIPLRLLSLEELESKGWDPSNEALILTQKEISDPQKIPSISDLIKAVLLEQVA